MLLKEKNHCLRCLTLFYFINKIAYVVKKRIFALACSFMNRFLRYFKSWKFGPFCIFFINKIFWNFEFLDPNFHIFGPRMPKNQKIKKNPIQWSQKLTLATFLLFSKKMSKIFIKKKIFDFFLENFFRKNLLIKKLPKPISKTSDLKL